MPLGRGKALLQKVPPPQLLASFFYPAEEKEEEAARERVQRREWSCSAALTGPVSSMSNMWSPGSPKSLREGVEKGTCDPFS